MSESDPHLIRTEDELREETGLPNLRVACIGPGGENLVRFACIMNDKHRAAGRSGVGPLTEGFGSNRS